MIHDHLPCQDKRIWFPLRHLPTNASALVRTIFARLSLDNPQRVSRISDDVKSCHRPIMQLHPRPRSVITDRTMVEEKGVKNTPRKEPWGLRWRSSVGFVTFGVCLSRALSRNCILILDIW